MRSAILASLVLLALFTGLTGLVYPLAVTGIARLAFPDRAAGSLLHRDDRLIGSGLLGQAWDDPRYFRGRPSASVPPANAAASTGSNLGPSNPALSDSLRDRVARLRALDPGNTALVPVDLVTASASGLDPEITPAAAYYQVSRVARLRGLDESAVRSLVDRFVQGRQLGILGEPRVNVLKLNLALDDPGFSR